MTLLTSSLAGIMLLINPLQNELKPIEDYSLLICPPRGACCLEQRCLVRTSYECSRLEGEYQGDYTACDSVICLEVVPIKSYTWGKVKSLFR